jgi:hypothetical protein
VSCEPVFFRPRLSRSSQEPEDDESGCLRKLSTAEKELR